MKSSTKYLKIVINYIFALIFILGCVYVLPKILTFFMPFVIAWIIALIANPLVKFLENKLKIRRKAGSVVVIILTLAIVVFACYYLIWFIVSQASGLATSMPEIWAKVSSAFRDYNVRISRYFSKMPKFIQGSADGIGEAISQALSDVVGSIGSFAAVSASNSFKNLPVTIVSIVMGVLASYSFVAEREYISETLNKVMPKEVKERAGLVIDTMKNAVGGYFKAQFKIMAFVYVALLIGFLILRVDYAFLVALLVAILDFLPFFGTGTAMWPWAFVAFIQNNYTFAIGMLITWGVSQLVRQVIQPKLLGDSVGMPAIPTLFLLYIGFRVGGAIGLIIAVPVGMILYNLYKAGVFSNFLYSTRILFRDLKKIRVFTKEELESEGISMSETGAGEGNTDKD